MKQLWTRAQGGPFLLLALTALFGLAIVGGLLSLQPVHAQGGPGEDHTGERCADCHVDYQDAWATGVHASAYDDPVFQDAWADSNNDPECLTCHTTLYQPHDGSFLDTNIHCEACHGLNPADHPPAELAVNRNTSACGDCHTDTFAQWQHSPHAFTEDMGTVACSTCHNPHGQTLRFDSVDALCLNCHETAPNTYVHLTHNEVDFEGVEVTCASCHMDDVPAVDDMHHIPDHTMHVETKSCTRCHEALSAEGNVPLLVPVDEALAAQRDELRTQVNELQAELEATAEVEPTTHANSIRLTQGLVAGLGFGIVMTWVLMRRATAGNGDNKSRRK